MYSVIVKMKISLHTQSLLVRKRVRRQTASVMWRFVFHIDIDPEGREGEGEGKNTTL